MPETPETPTPDRPQRATSPPPLATPLVPDLTWTPAATLDELWEGDLREVTLAGDRILLAHLPGGALRAYQGICPHAEYPLEHGDLDGTVLTCPAHGWEFDLATGTGVNPDNCTLYRYPIHQQGNTLYLGRPHDNNRHYHRCRG